MNLLSEWKWIARRAWSFRLVVLSGLLSGCEVVLPLFIDSMPRNVFAGLAMLAAVGGAAARLMAQPKMDRRKKPRAPGSDGDYD